VDWRLELTGGLLRDHDQRTGFVLLASLLVSFVFIRTSARLMRSPRVPWWPGSVTTSSGLHIHHLVFGVAMLMASGSLALLSAPESPWREVLAAVFGVGAGLTLDEFALLLYLRDVYWAEEGRKSLDAVIIATLLTGLAVLGVAPLDLDNAEGSIAAVAIGGLWILAISVVAALKGKVFVGIVGLFVPLVSLVGATRLAKPSSPWARWRYASHPRKLARATARHRREDAVRLAFFDRVAGAPSDERRGGTADGGLAVHSAPAPPQPARPSPRPVDPRPEARDH
jgi:lysyl-tRNA synthetase class 2